MKSTVLKKSTFEFLDLLSSNNNREWFSEHKDLYTSEHLKMIDLADSVLEHLKKHDTIETVSGKASLHRIYKDTRFSKDKTPYKNNWSASFRRATKAKRGGYYLHIEKGNSFVAGGFFSPNNDDLLRIRQDICVNYDEWNTVLNDKLTVKTFNQLLGNQLVTAPKGFEKDHPAIHLLRYKQFILKHHFTDEEVFHDDFALIVSDSFKKLRPFFDLMSEILTTDLNGESVI
jgi:uncharacterized protein (TIGR02453 family)